MNTVMRPVPHPILALSAGAQALIKAAERRVVKPQNSALGVGWAPSLMQQGWAGVVSAVSSWGKQHVGWALCVDQNISKVLMP